METTHDRGSPPISKSVNLIKVDEETPQAPAGKYQARCIHVEPNWSFFGNRKIALYFEITEGIHRGTTARRFYPLKRKGDTFSIGDKSKFKQDMQKLFPDKAYACEIDPVELFQDKFFDIVIVQRSTKNGLSKNSIVTEINHPELGW